MENVNENDAKAKLTDMMYSALIRMSYYHNIASGTDFNLNLSNRKNANNYNAFFDVMVSLYGKLDKNNKIEDLNKLIEDEIEGYDSELLQSNYQVSNVDVKNIFKEFVNNTSKDEELYSDFMKNSTMPTFINEQNKEDLTQPTSWARQNLRAISGNAISCEIKQFEQEELPEADEYNQEYINSIELYGWSNEKLNKVNNVIRRYNELFTDENGIVKPSGVLAYVLKKFIQVRSNDLSNLNKLISDAHEIEEENKDNKEICNVMKRIRRRISTLRDSISLERDLAPIITNRDNEVKSKVASFENIVNEQIQRMNAIRNIEQNKSFKRTLFLITSRCDEKSRNRIFDKLKNPNRDIIDGFINNNNLHDFIDKNPEKVSDLMWGFLNQPKVFYNSLSWQAKLKIFAVNQKDTKYGDLLANRNVLLEKMEDKSVDITKAGLLSIMYNRANIFNCRSIIRKMSSELLKGLSGLCKEFDLDANEKEKLIDYVYRNRTDFLDKNDEDTEKQINKLRNICRDELGFLTPNQKKIINALPVQEEKDTIRQLMKSDFMRKIIVDTNTAKNVELFMPLDNFLEIINRWLEKMRKLNEKINEDEVVDICKYFLQHMNLDKFFDVITENGIESGKRQKMKEIFSQLIFRKYFWQINSYASFQKLKESLDKVLNDEIYEEMKKLSIEFDKNKGELESPEISQGFILEFFEQDTDKFELYNICRQAIGEIIPLSIKNIEIKSQQAFKLILDYIDGVPDKIAQYFTKLPAEIAEGCVKDVEQKCKNNKMIFESFKENVIAYRTEIIKEAFNKNKRDCDKFISYLQKEEYKHSMIRHVNSPENTRTIFELVELGLKDPSKVTTKDLEYARELVSEGRCTRNAIVEFFNNGGENLAKLPKESITQIFDFVNSPELANLNYADRIREANVFVLLKKTNELADQIVNSTSDFDFEQFNGKSVLAQAVAESIIARHPYLAADIAEDLGRENPIGQFLYQNETICNILSLRQKNEISGSSPLFKLQTPNKNNLAMDEIEI